MQSLDTLTREAQTLASGHTAGTGSEHSITWHKKGLSSNESEVARQLQICNACRYCEGFCAVFPAMARRLEFDNKADLNYMANLCHNCGACLHACQYAPPHEFGVNIPQAMARVRLETYTDFAWPSSLGKLYKNNGMTLALATAFGLALFLVLTIMTNGSLLSAPNNGGNFYAIFPHNTLALMFGAVFAYAVLALGIGVNRFWKEITPGQASAEASVEALHNVLKLKYLDGGHGDGCNDEDDKFTLRRRRYHHFTFYGFMLCFAATSVATLYHYVLGLQAPYAYNSLPVILGSLGGIGLIIGPIGLMTLNIRRAKLHGDAAQKPMDHAFITLLLLTSLSGLALLIWRDTAALAILLALHLGVVMALFLTMPYGKFAHGIFRTAALLKWSIEKRMPNKLGLGSE
jgi:citrate/tricarballylate utilization protein